jgi:hypothetical protein
MYIQNAPRYLRNRAPSAATMAARALKADIYFAAFKIDQPVVYEWLVANPNFEFAASMVTAIKRYGSLTEKQLAACEKIIARNAERAAQPVAAGEQVDISKIMLAFDAARANQIKRPKLRLAGFEFSCAPATGKNPGAVYVKDGAEYIGKIETKQDDLERTQSKFFATRECGAERRSKVVEVASDPMGAAVAYGRRTGQCACCGRLLTVGVSIDRGIGPICAERYGW